jgi:hypothetical protein
MTRLCGKCGNRITAKDIAARRFVFSTKSRTYFCIRCALSPAPVPVPVASLPLRQVPARGLGQR